MKRVVGIIGTNGLPGKYGGWDQLVDHLTKQLNGDVSFIVYTSYTSADPNIREVNRAKIKSIPFKANGIQSIPYDILSMIHAGFFCDVLFICGTSGCIALPAIGMFGKKIILNPDGQEWKRKKWSKPVKWFLKISELFGAHFSSTLVADNVIIQKYLKSKYGKESVLIEYGGDQVVKVEMKSETSKKYAISAGKYAFKVCRIEPENNIHLILDAFKHVREMNLVIVGNWNYSEYGKRLRRYYLEFQNIKMVDPIYEQVTLDELRSNCGLYIHGHSVGGTNPSLVEAMNLGLFIAAYNVTYNIETTENSAIYFNSVDELKTILWRFTNNQYETNIYRTKMAEIAGRRYLWRIVTQKYLSIFGKVKG